MTQIILVQSRNVRDEYQYRIAKLIGAVFVSYSQKRFYVGDLITEADAEKLLNAPSVNPVLPLRYEITITEKGGAQ